MSDLEPVVRVRKRGFLRWEAEVLTQGERFGAGAVRMTRRRAIKAVLRYWRKRNQPWEEVE